MFPSIACFCIENPSNQVCMQSVTEVCFKRYAMSFPLKGYMKCHQFLRMAALTAVEALWLCVHWTNTNKGTQLPLRAAVFPLLPV